MSVSQNEVRSTSKYVKILMDSGANVSIIHDSFVRKNKYDTKKTSANKWTTMAGFFWRHAKMKLKFNFQN